ncbi:hypothetical protein GTR02_21085 [Kineococcus sp. R8]|uniref:hypothetical protein n=1 Tax=Kineococcus siccus TaxID=2696567 RepID=UPI001412D443|nr:hypothetical protein [Kineococcus siccus]NAZ84301.1 hypothetical protein [Kineococcus siccus]
MLDEPLDRSEQYQHGADRLPLTSGNQLAGPQRSHDPQAAPQRVRTILLSALGSLLVIAIVAWLTLR